MKIITHRSKDTVVLGDDRAIPSEANIFAYLVVGYDEWLIPQI